MKLINEIRQTADGAAIIRDWLGDGGVPVEDWHAEARADVCEHCRENVQPDWWDKVKESIAVRIKSHLAVKHQLGFRVKNEDKLGMCKICGCCNPLAVWCPIKHIAEHTSQDHLKAFPKVCWKRVELEAM